ncbi:MAG: molybdenum cofactor guanylyltransferase [Collinsella sp.]
MPFVSPELIGALADRVEAEAFDVCVPREKRGLSRCAPWRRQACAPVARELLDQDRQRIRCLIDQVHAGYLNEPQIVEVAGSTLCFENVNTPEEFAAAELPPRRWEMPCLTIPAPIPGTLHLRWVRALYLRLRWLWTYGEEGSGGCVSRVAPRGLVGDAPIRAQDYRVV